jgi:hypothetical protein
MKAYEGVEAWLRNSCVWLASRPGRLKPPGGGGEDPGIICMGSRAGLVAMETRTFFFYPSRESKIIPRQCSPYLIPTELYRLLWGRPEITIQMDQLEQSLHRNIYVHALFILLHMPSLVGHFH